MYFFNSKISAVFTFILTVLLVACNPKEPVTVVSVNGEEINLINEGSGDISIVLVHGFGNDNSIWSDQIGPLSEKYHVIALDLPGFGKSTRNRTEYAMTTYGSDVKEVVNALDLKKVVLVGFSMGTPVVLEAAQLMDDELMGLILVDHIKDTSIHFTDEMVQGIQGFLNDLMADPTQEKLVAGGFYKQNLESSTERVHTMLSTMEPFEGWNQAFVDIFKWANERDEMTLASAGAPIALINADYEPTNFDQISSLFPGIQIDVMKETGHCVMWDFPEKFNELVVANVERFSSEK